MREQIRKLQEQSQGSISREEYQKILGQNKIVDGQIKQFRNEFDYMQQAVDQFKDGLYKLQKAPSEEEFLVMRTRMDAAENTIGQQGKKVDQNVKALKQLKSQFGQGGDFENLVEQIEKINDQLADQTHEFSEYRDAIKKELEVIADTLSKKADTIELEQLQALLQKQLGDQTQLIRDTCAPKDETSRKLNQLSRKVRDLFEMVGKAQGTSEDGMLTKRHIGPNACASCDKTLVNKQGLQA